MLFDKILQENTTQKCITCLHNNSIFTFNRKVILENMYPALIHLDSKKLLVYIKKEYYQGKYFTLYCLKNSCFKYMYIMADINIEFYKPMIDELVKNGDVTQIPCKGKSPHKYCLTNKD